MLLLAGTSLQLTIFTKKCVNCCFCDRTPGEVPRPQTAGAALPSRQLQQSEYSHSSPSPLGSSLQQNVLHSSLTPEVQQALLQASRSSLALPGYSHLSPYLSTTTMPAPPFDSAQQSMDSQQLPSLLHSSLQANLNSSTQQEMASLQSVPPLQLPAHVQQWLATLAHDAQQAAGSRTALDQPASRERHAQASASSPDRAAASAEVQEYLRQMKAELADVKARFAETQVWSLTDCCHLSLHGYSEFSCESMAGPKTSQQHGQEPQKQHTIIITISLDGPLISHILHAGYGVIKGTLCEQPLCSMCITVVLRSLSMTCQSTGMHVDFCTHRNATNVVIGCA